MLRPGLETDLGEEASQPVWAAQTAPDLRLMRLAGTIIVSHTLALLPSVKRQVFCVGDRFMIPSNS